MNQTGEIVDNLNKINKSIQALDLNLWKETDGVVSLINSQNNLSIGGNISASGDINASGNISANNLSGTNTGDQDLSGLIPYTGANQDLNLGLKILKQDDQWGIKWYFAGTSDTVEMNQSETAWKWNVGGGGVTKYRFNTTKDGSINGPILDLGLNGDATFYGNVGIGTTTPNYKTHIVGTLGVNPGSSVDPQNNGDIVVEATNDTTLTFKLKGSDGTVRAGTVTLS